MRQGFRVLVGGKGGDGMARILITDDAALMRQMLGDILRREGYEVDEAESGRDCVDKVAKESYDLVTMDITMPEMDGLQTLKVIKDLKPEQRVIMVSAMGQTPMVVDAIRYGACDFVVKPFDAKAILKIIDNVLKR